MKNVPKKIIKVSTRMGIFDCVFTPNVPEKGYTVTVPKMKGMITFGDTEKEAVAMAQEAIELHCGCLLERGFAEVRAKLKAPVKVKKAAVR